MSILNLEHITKAFGEKKILDDITAALEEGQRTGIVGINGAGKSTLLAIAAGKELPDDGQVICRRGLRISYLSQTPSFDPKCSIGDNVAGRISGKAAHWDTAGEAKALLQRFGISDPSALPGKLSGGQRKRAALIAALLTPCDLLILDEPTNHLDHEMITWLEEWIRNFSGALLLVTHDRYFLDACTECIWELDGGRLYSYKGNYSDYLELRQQRLDDQKASERKMAALYRQDLKWMLRGARARSTKQKAHIARFEALRDRQRIMEERSAQIASLPTRLGRTIIEVGNLKKGFGDHLLFHDFSYAFTRTDRIGIIGKNGCGKSTLLRILMGQEVPDLGSVTIGQTVNFGYFAQEVDNLDPKSRVIDCVREVAEYVRTPEGTVSASAMCDRFLFPPQVQFTPVSKLSGGEKRRLQLLRVLMSSPNVLVLDEPTNDLDIQTLQVLEDYLDSFSGVILAVSHDRYFLDRVVTRIFSFEEDLTLHQSEGAFSEYEAHKNLQEQQERVQPQPQKGKPALQPEQKPAESGKENRIHHSSRRLSFSEQREYDGLEKEIDRLTKEAEELGNEMLEAASDYPRLSSLSRQKDAVDLELDQKIERFLALEEKLEGMT